MALAMPDETELSLSRGTCDGAQTENGWHLEELRPQGDQEEAGHGAEAMEGAADA